MQSTLLAMINTRNLQAVANSYQLVVNRLWQVKRQINWPPYAEH